MYVSRACIRIPFLYTVTLCAPGEGTGLDAIAVNTVKSSSHFSGEWKYFYEEKIMYVGTRLHSRSVLSLASGCGSRPKTFFVFFTTLLLETSSTTRDAYVK